MTTSFCHAEVIFGDPPPPRPPHFAPRRWSRGTTTTQPMQHKRGRVVGDSPNPVTTFTGWGSPAKHLRESGDGSLANPTTVNEEDFPPLPPPSTPSFFIYSFFFFLFLIFVAFCFEGYAKVARMYTWQCFGGLTWLFVHMAKIPLVY